MWAKNHLEKVQVEHFQNIYRKVERNTVVTSAFLWKKLYYYFKNLQSTWTWVTKLEKYRYKTAERFSYQILGAQEWVTVYSQEKIEFFHKMKMSHNSAGSSKKVEEIGQLAISLQTTFYLSYQFKGIILWEWGRLNSSI